jgi:para-aminobenzoate synthetase component 1
MADPVETWTLSEAKFGDDPFASLRPVLEHWRCNTVPDLPPFQGGIAGLVGYELGRCWERVPAARHDEFQLPVLAAGLYDWVIAWDHQTHRAWLISHGWPEVDETRRRERAAVRMRLVCEALTSLQTVNEGQPPHSDPLPRRSRKRNPTKTAAVASPANHQTLLSLHPKRARCELLVPQFLVEGLPGLMSNFSRSDYLKAVARVIEYIRSGDIFQANLTQRLLAHASEDTLDLYQRLRRVNPAPFAGLMRWNDWAVVSASPERFLRVDGCEVETRPIKGTRRRKCGPEADLFTRDELRESEKDQAENVMIVDLLRNDLSRVCEAGSIRVPQLCGVETYETVQHLVSEVRGRLRTDATVWDLFRATLRAMEIIAELEPTARGPYCGSLFYVGANGQSDSNLLIRTFVERHGWLQLGVGGGIVAQSDPASEYEETLAKAAGMVRALR